MKIGIDIGRVLIGADTDQADIFFKDQYLEAAAVPYAFEATKLLVQHFGASNVYIVSKCGATIRQRSLDWLIHHDFYTQTGFAPSNVYFTYKREEKDLVCRQHGISIFVDDRLSVLLPMFSNPDVVCLYLFRPNDNDRVEAANTQYGKLKIVDGWIDVLGSLGLEIPVDGKNVVDESGN